MHFSYRYALPQHGIGSYAVTSANGECSAYTDMTDYESGLWTRPANLYIDLSYPEVAIDNNVHLLDGKPVAYPSAITSDKLIYSRHFTNTSWQPLYVPFPMSYGDWSAAGLEVASINALGEVQDESGNTVKVLKVTKVTTGCIIRNFICSK